MTSRKSSTFWSTILDTLLRPEATTRMSTRPNLSTAALTILSQFSSEFGRSAMTSVLLPSCSHSAATFPSSSVLLAASTTLAPAPANVFAAKAPKAPDAPVMMAVLPLISNNDSGFVRKSSDTERSLREFSLRHARHKSDITPVASFRRVRHGDHDRAHLIAAIDDLARLVWFDHAGIVGFEHRLLAVDDDSQFAPQHEIDLLGW